MNDDELRVRIAIVETEIRYIRDDVKDIISQFDSFRQGVYERFESISNQLVALQQSIENVNNPGLSSREKASIIIALITSISSIVIALIQTFV